MLAPGAARILALRKAGNRPGENVVVSVVGEKPVEWLVQPDLDTSYDWMWVVDLDLWVLADTTTDAGKLRTMMADIKSRRPRRLHLWLDDLGVGYEVWSYPTVETAHLPRGRWQMTTEMLKMSEWENDVMKSLFNGINKEAA